MNLLRNTSFMLYLALAIAFFFPGPAEQLKFLIIPALFFVMLFSLKNLKQPKFTKANNRSAVYLMLANFVLLSGALLLLTFFVKNPDYRAGIIVLAAMPPAISFIALSSLLGGNVEKAFISEIFSYVFTFLFTPAIIYFFFRESVSLVEIFKILFILIIIPYLASRPLTKVKYDFKEFINIFYAFGFYLAIGLSLPKIINGLAPLLSIFIMFIILKFGIAYVVYWIGKSGKMPKEEIPLYTVNSTIKNSNMAIGIVLVLFSPIAVVPLTIHAIVDSVYTLFLFRLFKK